MSLLNETADQVAQGMLKGGVRGGVAGALLSIASGAAVIVTFPFWFPVIGSSIAISTGTMATWSAIAGAAGICIGGGKSYYDKQQRDKEFNALINKERKYF